MNQAVYIYNFIQYLHMHVHTNPPTYRYAHTVHGEKTDSLPGNIKGFDRLINSTCNNICGSILFRKLIN